MPGDSDGRAQFMRYLPAWHEGVVYRGNWNNTGHPASAICDAQTISQLTGLGYALDAHSLSTTAPPDDEIERLRQSLAVWHELLDGGQIPKKLASELRAHVDRLRMLLETDVIKTFGVEPVIDASNNLFGAAILAMGRLPGRAAKSIGIALVSVAAFLHTAHGAVDDANGMLEGLITMVYQVRELTDPQKELGGAETSAPDAPQLEPSSGTNQDPVDVEVVETGPTSTADADEQGQG